MTETIKPFDKGYFVIHNAVFDIMMPALSANAFKVLCVAIRQTMGWQKDADRLSYSQFAQLGGMSKRTAIRAVQECLKMGYLLREVIGHDSRSNAPLYAYSLNTDIEIVASSGDKITPPSGDKITPPSGDKLAQTIIHKQQTTHDGDDDILNCEQLELNAYYNPAVTNELVAFGIDATTARKLSADTTLETVTAWIEHARANDSLKNPQGFVVSRLRSGEKPPQLKRDRQRRRRYLEYSTV